MGTKRPPPPGLEDDLTRVRGQIASLQQAVEELRAALTAVQGELKDLKQSLGA